MYDESYEVTERNLLQAVVYSFVTLGIYSLYWMYKLQQDTNRLMGLRDEPSPAAVVVLTVVTFGIYGCYWAWRQGVKFREEARSRGSSEADDCPPLYLALQLVNYLAGVTYIVNMILMQDRINQLLRMRGQGTRPYDPNRFRHIPEAEIAEKYKARAAAYEAEIAEDEEVLNALEGKRALYLTGDMDSVSGPNSAGDAGRTGDADSASGLDSAGDAGRTGDAELANDPNLSGDPDID